MIMRHANRYAKKYAGYSLKQASATRQLGSNHLPVLIIHGEEDQFVPVSAAYTIQNATAGENDLSDPRSSTFRSSRERSHQILDGCFLIYRTANRLERIRLFRV